ncbi:GHKL domain-containing protein [Ruminococcus sp. AF37-20]|nr:GHKL domain-containing protein [Ruminococcus sp. AF37-20]
MKNLLWKCFELVINYYQGFIMTWFVYRFLNPKSLKQAKTFLSIFSIIFGTTITLLNHITLYEEFTSTLYLVILLVYAIIAFNDSIIKKLLSTIIPNIILLLITSVELNLLSSLNRISVKDLITNDNSVRFMTLIVIQISLWISLKIIIKLFKFSDSYTISDWSPIITVLISSFILVSLLHVLSLNADDTQRIYINLSYLVIIILNFLMFYVIYSLFFKNAQIKNMKVLSVKEQYMEQYVNNAETQYELIRKIRHDIKNQLSAVYFMLSKNETQEAMNLISKSCSVVNGIETYVRTDSAVANSIINSKLSAAAALGIKVSCITVSDFTGISETDLCDLLSNSLENAVTACKNMPIDANRFIYLEIGKENNIYTFLIKNSMHCSVLNINPQLKTTKSDKQNHGLGTAIIKDIACKYNGRYDFYEIDNTFCCSVILET